MHQNLEPKTLTGLTSSAVFSVHVSVVVSGGSPGFDPQPQWHRTGGCERGMGLPPVVGAPGSRIQVLSPAWEEEGKDIASYFLSKGLF